MPELPEVEIVRQNLQNLVTVPARIQEWIFFRQDLRFNIPKRKLMQVCGRPLIRISRRAKYLLFEFQDDVVVSHLGMTGSWRRVQADWNPEKHDHLAFVIDEKNVFVYQDARRFGFIEVIKRRDLAKRFAGLGPEPLELQNEEAVIALTSVFKKLKSPIKTALMNQKYIVGVGNIYASEALFSSKISPFRKCSKLTQKEYARLWKNVRKILSEAIAKGGSTIDNYKNAYGEAGNFQKEFFVYGRENKVCLICNTHISQKTIAGRSTFWCKACQK